MFKSVDNKSGYTLLELILLIIIIGILASVATGGFQKAVGYYKLQLSATELLSYLRKTKHMAVTHHDTYGIELISDNEYGLFKDDESDYIEQIEFKEGITAAHSRSNDETTFSPLGTAYSGSFTLSNENGSSIKVVISYSGRIKMEKMD